MQELLIVLGYEVSQSVRVDHGVVSQAGLVVWLVIWLVEVGVLGKLAGVWGFEEGGIVSASEV